MRAAWVALTVALLAGTLLAVPARAEEGVTVASPLPYGMVELGRSVALSAFGEGCSAAAASVLATVDGGSVAGPTVAGCAGEVPVPTEADLAAVGWAPGEALELALDVGGAVVPLRHRHIDTATAAVAAGSPTVVLSSGDQQSPDGGALLMQSGDVLDLGLVDLSGVYGVAVRGEGAFDYEFRADAADGAVLSADSGGRSRIDWMIRRPDHNRPYQLTTSELTGQPTDRPTPLFFAVTSGVALVNFVELTGSGAMAPHRFASPLPDAVRLFNGVDLDDWEQMGPGGFHVEDGLMVADPPPSGQWGWHAYTPRTFKDFVMRLEFRTAEWGDNSGVLIRHARTGEQNQSAFTAEEIQITDVNTEYTGGMDHVQTAFTQPQSSPGDWSTMEIVANGPDILVRVNGVVTSVYDGRVGCGWFALPCAGGANGGYLDGGNGYISVEAEVGPVAFRNLEVHDCAADSDPLCAEA